MRKVFFIILIGIGIGFGSCKKYLDIVPDNVPVLDHAFNLRQMALRFLATCYNDLPSSTSIGGNMGFLGADEFWLNSTSNYSSSGYPTWYIAMGQQNANSPLLNTWGSGGRGALWQAIYNCNTMIERVSGVPDMDESEKEMWAAEAKVLKAYYHFLLVRQYGPIIIVDNNSDVFDSPDEMHIPRSSVDECFNYIVNTIDEAIPALMPAEQDGNLDVGRITQIVAKAIKAKVLVEAASPLYNGNTDMASLKDESGNSLFNQTYDEAKWERAAQACLEAIQFAEKSGKSLNRWTQPANVVVNAPSTRYQMNVNTAFNESDDNPEVLWFDTRSIAGSGFQAAFTPRGFNANTVSNSAITSYMGATLNMAERFYSKNGIPIEEDKTYPYGDRYQLTSVPSSADYSYVLTAGYQTVKFHMDREPRFYGTLSMDGGRYFMLSNGNDNNAANTNYKQGGNVTKYNVINYAGTGYMVKKYVNYQNSYGANNAYSARSYAIPFIRLADLYLMYSESVNESQSSPSNEAYRYIDSVRLRAGLDGVLDSWANFSNNPSKPLTKDGFREIIKRERTIELAFEGKRFWDLRRWKDAVNELNELILGWDIDQRTASAFYRQRPLFNRVFTTKDYFWPISLDELRRNSALKQNVGW